MHNRTDFNLKRYQDEAGTPCFVTIDYGSKQNGTVRDRDSMEQERVHKDELSAYTRNRGEMVS